MGKKIFVVKLPAKPVSERFQKELNEEQCHVATHEKGPALVIAGAGSGKTRALTYRVAYLIEQGVSPSGIVLVTFTKKAAEEMTRRADRVSGGRTQGLLAGTFHHLANLFLRKYAQVLVNFALNSGRGIKKGDVVRVRGRLEGFRMDVIMKECVLVD